MKTNERGLNIIKKYEGLRLETYICPAGRLTIGYGHTASATFGKVITEEEANKLLERDVLLCEMYMDKFVRVPLNSNQYSALISLMFNIGSTAIKRSTLLEYLNKKYYNLVASEIVRWNKSKGKVLPGLTRRRDEERTLFLTPTETV